jgi:AraC-like DNA-binding protein/Tfp pilus assembly protein PilF
LANKAIDLAGKIGYEEGIAHGTGMLGSLYNSKGKYDSAIYFYKKSLYYFEEEQDSLYMAKMYNNIGLSNDFLGYMDSAMYYYSKSLDIKKNLKDTMGIITCLNNIGASFFYYEMYDEAMDYYHQCIPLEEAIEDEEGLAMTYLNMGELFLKTMDYEQAEKNLSKAHEINKNVNSNYLQSMIWDNLALVYMNLGNINEARDCFERAIELNKILNDHEALSNNYLSMGKFMHQSGNLNKAVEYYSSAFNECTRSGFVKRASDAAKALSKLYAQRSNYRKSLHYHELYSDLKDSVINIENNRQMAEMRTKYETEKKEKQLIQKKLELEQNAREIKQQRLVSGFSIAGGIIFLVFSLFIYGQYKRKDEAYRQLVKKNLDMVKCEQVQESNQQDGVLEKSLKYNKSALSDDQKGRIARELQELIKTTKPFRDPTLGIDALATRLNTNRSYLSQIINEFYEQNFYSFINDMRVKEARRLLANPEYRKLSIEGIARQVGFNSKSSFNTAFKKLTGVTPSYFSKTIQEEENIS